MAHSILAGFLLGSTSLVLMPTAALAQDREAKAQEAPPPADEPPQGDSAIKDIIVTAQKRAQSVQEVPIAVSAFTAEALETRAVSTVAQLGNVTPNVTLDAGTPFSGSSAVLSAFIRGIGSDDFAFNIDPGVGIYIDGVYLARTVGANQDLLDIERVEVLKGPQGTLFGRNTIGGAISIVTRNPGDTFRLVGDLTAGSFNYARLRVSADLPIAPGLGMLVSAAVKTRDGYLQRIPFPDTRAANADAMNAFPASGYSSNEREGGDNDRVFRMKLRYDNGGAFTATLGADYTFSDSTGLANKLLGVPETPGNFAGTANLPGTGFDPTGTTGFSFAGLYNFCIGATPAEIAARGAAALCGGRGTQFSGGFRLPGLGSRNVDGDPSNDLLPWDNRFVTDDKDSSYATGMNFSRLRNWGATLTLDYDLSNDIAVRSISAYRKLDWRAGIDGDGTPLNFLHLSFPLDQKQFSQELQLIGKGLGGKLNYVLGAYYFEESGNQRDFVTFAEGLVQVDGDNVFDTKNYAFFGQVDWRPIDLIGVTLGGRYTSETKQFEGFQQELNGFNYKLFGCSDANGNVTPGGAFPLAPIPCAVGLSYPDPTNPVRVYPPGLREQKFDNFAPKVSVQIHPAERVMLYGSWSQGYKTGGWTTRLTNPQTEVDPFGEELVTTWEIGIKSQMFDRRLQINAAAFSTDYEGIQLNFQEGTSPTIRNAGDARIQGFEIEAVLSAARGLTLNASVGYLHTEYTDVLPGVLAVSAPDAFQAGTEIGATLPKSPNWKTSIAPQYVTALPGGSTLTLAADWSHSSDAWNNAQRTFALRRDAYDLVNANITWVEPDGRYSIGAGGTNILGSRYLTTGNSNVAVGTFFGTYNRPAEWFVRFGFNF
ncbi:TonB-dependent receptor [Sphingomonas sp. 37zxx]|uniref:TonB-dependent receptor n=1 Tax=Sphingomonas sp. 37zxx TaxID=1550073 RepID=UPI00053BEF25|nr:TonB-dependent receptor [Sphingomonas sp. 37zxx]